VLILGKKFHAQMVGHCLDGYPLEACGLLTGIEGPDGTEVTGIYPSANLSASSRVYEVDPKVMLRADREAGAEGGQVVGVYHSHTHTEAQPSRTDIKQAPDPEWHYVLVSLRDVHPGVRSWRIEDGMIREESVVLQW
jgi:proteasome lid subunit RPN8/RPN11